MSGQPGTIRIAIVDDHPVARYGMQLIFDADPGIEIAYAGDSLAGMRSWPRSGVSESSP